MRQPEISATNLGKVQVDRTDPVPPCLDHGDERKERCGAHVHLLVSGDDVVPGLLGAWKVCNSYQD